MKKNTQEKIVTMLRCASRLCLRLRNSAALAEHVSTSTESSGLLTKLQPTSAPPSAISLHTSAACLVLDRDERSKKKLMRMATEERIEHLAPETGSVDVDGISSGGIAIPTMETLSMTVNGVRYDELPIIYIQSTTNNTIITLTNHTGREVMDTNSCGKEGFRNAKKSTTVAAQATGYSLGYRAKKKGLKAVRIKVKGIGSGRLPCIKGIEMAGIQIVSITDDTPLKFYGGRSRKARRT